jgi:hypothetical protein
MAPGSAGSRMCRGGGGARRRPFLVAVPLLVLAGISTGCDGEVVTVVPVSSVSIEPDPVQVIEGSEVQTMARLRGPAGQPVSGREVTWSVDDASIASIPQQAPSSTVRGLAVGETTLRARAQGIEGTARLQVLRGPTIALAPSGLSFAGTEGDEVPAEGTVSVTNAGAGSLGVLSLTLHGPGGSPAPGWLSAELASPEAPTSVQVRADLSGLGPGVYAAEVRVDAPEARNGPVTLPVEVQVAARPPAIAVDPDAVAFGAVAGTREPASQDVAVTNAGGGDLVGMTVAVVYTSGPGGWLSASLSGPDAPATLTLEALAQELAEGVYEALVRVSAPGAQPSSVDVEIRFNVSGG